MQNKNQEENFKIVETADGRILIRPTSSKASLLSPLTRTYTTFLTSIFIIMWLYFVIISGLQGSRWSDIRCEKIEDETQCLLEERYFHHLLKLKRKLLSVKRAHIEYGDSLDFFLAIDTFYLETRNGPIRIRSNGSIDVFNMNKYLKDPGRNQFHQKEIGSNSLGKAGILLIVLGIIVVYFLKKYDPFIEWNRKNKTFRIQNFFYGFVSSKIGLSEIKHVKLIQTGEYNEFNITTFGGKSYRMRDIFNISLEKWDKIKLILEEETGVPIKLTQGDYLLDTGIQNFPLFIYEKRLSTFIIRLTLTILLILYFIFNLFESYEGKSLSFIEPKILLLLTFLFPGAFTFRVFRIDQDKVICEVKGFPKKSWEEPITNYKGIRKTKTTRGTSGKGGVYFMEYILVHPIRKKNVRLKRVFKRRMEEEREEHNLIASILKLPKVD